MAGCSEDKALESSGSKISCGLFFKAALNASVKFMLKFCLGEMGGTGAR
jgi:hypothetical protein